MKLLFSLTAAASLVFGATSASAQTPVFFDGFLTDNATIPANDFNNFILWDVTNGSVDLVQADIANVNRYVDLAGSSNNPGTFATRAPIAFAARTIYALRFDYLSAGGGTNAAFARIAAKTFPVQTDSTTFVSFSQNFSFSSARNETLKFNDSGPNNDNFGIGIDNITVVALGPDQPPTVTILTKSNANRVNPALRVRGRASDDMELFRVQVKVRGGSFRNATGLERFKRNVNLRPGNNRIVVRAIDSVGNVSQRQSIRVRLVTPS